jgi:hypothetical protein
MLRRLLPLCPADRPTERAGVDAEIRPDRVQPMGAGFIRCRHGRPLVTVCLCKRLQPLSLRDLSAILFGCKLS